MVHITGRYPSRILSRLRHQAPRCNQFQSCQAELIINLPTGAAVQANAQNGVVSVFDLDQILPYNSLEFSFYTGAPTISSPYNVPVPLTVGMTESQVAAAFRIAFDNWRALWSPTFKVFSEMRIESLDVATDPKSKIYFPWGVLGAINISYVSPGVVGLSAAPGNPGVDNPILSGLWGPQRFAFPVRPTYDNPYYGDVPIG